MSNRSYQCKSNLNSACALCLWLSVYYSMFARVYYLNYIKDLWAKLILEKTRISTAMNDILLREHNWNVQCTICFQAQKSKKCPMNYWVTNTTQHCKQLKLCRELKLRSFSVMFKLVSNVQVSEKLTVNLCSRHSPWAWAVKAQISMQESESKAVSSTSALHKQHLTFS